MSSLKIDGSFQTAAYIIVSGHYSLQLPYVSYIFPSTDTGMVSCYADVAGFCYQARTNNGAVGERDYDALDYLGNYAWSLDGNAYQMRMGRAGTTSFASMDTFFGWPAPATFRFGAADNGTPVGQTLKVQNALGTNVAGANLTIIGSQGTGNQPGGAINFQVAPSYVSSANQNTLFTLLSINPSVGVVVPNSNFLLTNGYDLSWSGGGGIGSGGYGNFQFNGATSFGLSALATGVAALGNGSPGDYSGTLKTTSVITAALTYATLPASPTAGQRAFITDANTTTFNAAVSSGGGSTKVSVLYNGSAWVVN